MWIQGSSDVTTSWSGLVALPAPDYYNGHPLLTTYKTCYEAYISLNGELNALGYFNLAVIVHSRPGVIGATRYKKNAKIKSCPDSRPEQIYICETSQGNPNVVTS
jgi:hypothetical protein